MMTEPSSRGDPEPIEAEFEPSSPPRPHQKTRRKRSYAPPPFRSRTVTLPALLLGCTAAAILGAVMAIVVVGANSGASTGTLAREIDALTQGQAALAARADQVSADLVTLRTRVSTQGDRLAGQDVSDAAIRTELTAITAQLAALIGAGDGAASASAAASASPLGALLARINRIETTLADDGSAPQTTRQMQRAVADLSDQVKALEAANTRLTTALDKRQLAMSVLENGLRQLDADLAAMRTDAGARPAAVTTARREAQPAAGDLAATGSRTIRALSALESAAQTGKTFAPQQQALAALLPQDVDVAGLFELSVRGAPTLDQLRRDLNASATGVEAMAAGQPDDGWNWLRGSITGMVSSPRGDSAAVVAQRLSAARRALEDGDVRTAIASIDTLTGAPGAAFKAWRDGAKRRADLDDRLQVLNQKLVGDVALASEG